ncbi:MAG: insulinase family protein [Chloroflexi bacterium]|nr:insulinase family protein [Chloroflexota bacterium]
MFERTALPDGPRVISARLPGRHSLSAAAYVLAGSRMESRERSGVAHFMEHVTFKGTAAYPTTRAVSEAIEGLGGNSNAATDRESTVYWTRLPGRELERAVDVLAELTVRPLLRDEDILKERDIIVEEIRSYRDDPAQHIFNVFDETFFGDTPLGWEIAGDEESVRGLAPRTVRDFWRTTYRPANIVVALAGDFEHQDAVALVSGAFGQGNGPVPDFSAAPSLPNGQRFRLEARPGAQAHLCLGMPALRRDDPDAWTLELLNTLLGDGASSRLFLKVREEHGLAYDVHSFQVDYADCGVLEIYAGVDPDRLEAAMAAILLELARLRDDLVPEAELAKARAYARGRLEIRLEEGRHLASWIGVQEALHDRVLTLEEALAAIDSVTSESVRALCERLIRDELLTLAVIAPGRRARRLERSFRLP